MQGQHWVVNSEFTKKEFIKHVAKLYDQHKHVTFQWRTGKQRTLKQNNALHLFLQHLADCLNDAGLDMRAVLKEGVEIPWTQDNAKEHLWKPLQKAVIGEESTADAERQDYAKVQEVLARHMGEKFGITIPKWPHSDKV